MTKFQFYFSKTVLTKFPMKPLCLLAILVFTNSAYLSRADHKTLSAHSHGAAELNVAMEGASIEAEFKAPNEDVLGFEHVPHSDFEKKLVEQLKEKLEKQYELFTLPKEAECKALEREVDLDFPETALSEASSQTPSSERTPNHSDFEFSIKYTCLNPKKIKNLDVTIFKQFPTLTKVQLQMVNEDKQTSETLTPKKTKFKVQP